MKIFGLNILTDKQLELVKENQWDNYLKYLKVKNLYKVKENYEQRPKCPNCNEERKISVTLPDGTTTLVECSCDKYDSEFYIDTVTVDCVMRIGDELYIRGYSFDQYGFRIFFTKEEVDEYHKASKFNSLQMCCYANKATANYALKLIKEEREKRNA